MSIQPITAVQAPVAEPYLIGFPEGLSVWEITLPVGRTTLLCGWQFRDADDQPLFWVGANGKPEQLTKEAAIHHARQWEFAQLCWDTYDPDACYEPQPEDPAGEPDFDGDD